MDYLTINKLLIRDKTVLQSIINSSDFEENTLQKAVIRKGERIVQNTDNNIYIIKEGYLAKMIAHEKDADKMVCQAFLSTSDIVWGNQFSGEVGVIYEPLSSAIVTKIDANTFFNILATHPFFTDVLIESLNRNEELAKLYAQQFQYELRERVIKLFEQMGVQISINRYALPRGLDSYYIAAYCGTSRTSASRIIRELKKMDILKKNNNGILTFSKAKI
ncbi:hypothetical protein BMT55_09010 [Listeria newyorkensis]|uniref:Crp/Fnr family transcriptional regulator n=1 Tax=Listeria newyorkensis TaxID=1497681 RepID=A0ABX4XM33_9LIST|nr:MULTISPECIES: Crp/Fnr family transcriptional regulator [Listeria]KGL46685.1 hypothetical protein EP56_00705 [Listeriaceae bacterium FSL A5-0209]KGL37441.1 hypothetical protein EP58_16935 [Listeria newyorkensis]PNP92100.1 hypothetical protein BMT55_09010 [Listeria newyorkensis]RQW65901.1 Crp/Fnr family transcriptional regulator [Listeria sp. SHR_NRA_18]WAO23153.1 Crp/Fnr family transcriptional regulator [Listeria newyorkensis]